MSLQSFYKGLRDFLSASDISTTIKKSKRFDGSKENIENVKVVQLLDAEKQRTYLVATPENVYKVVDDRRKKGPVVTWSRPVSKVAPNREWKVHIEPYRRTTDYVTISGLPGHSNLVSRKLFKNISLTSALNNLVKD